MFEVRKHFASDNNSGVLPEILKALPTVSEGHVPSYGDDPVTTAAFKEFQRLFGNQVKVYYVFNGTAANVIALQSLLKSYQAVICASEAHIQKDECGAPEKHLGSKLLLCDSQDAKITVEQIEQKRIRMGDVHHVQAKVISITQPTEYGTLYSLKEIQEISDYAKRHNMYLHLDGSRLVNAAVRLGCTLKQMTTDLGVDIVSFGGTKNGLMMGEAIVCLNPDLQEDLRYLRKQYMQLAGKMRFLSIQFLEWLKEDRWKKYSKQTCEMASYLESELKKIPGVTITQKVESNAVFAILPKQVLKPLREKFFFYIWNELNGEVRLMTSFDTQKDDVDAFVSEMKKLL